MPMYFFHIRDHDQLILDEEGLDLPHDDAARIEAKASATDLMRDATTSTMDIMHQSIEVMDTEGAMVVTILLREVMGRSEGRH